MKLTARAKQLWMNAPIILGKPRLYGKILNGLFRGIVLKKPTLRYLELQVNTECNQHCEACFASKSRIPGRTALAAEEIGELWRRLKKLGAIQGILTGGEPTLREDLFEVFEALESRKSMFAMTTNGLVIDRAYVERLKKIGLSYLAVSLNSLDAATNDAQRGTPGHYDHVMDVIGWCKEASLPVGLSTLLSHQNIEEFGRMAAFCHDKGIQIVPAFAVSQGRWAGHTSVRLTTDDYRRLDELNGMYPSIRSELTNNYHGRTSCPGGSEKVFVTVYGDMTTCQLNPISFGNIRLEDPKTIWQRMLKVESFAKINPMCVVSSDDDFVDNYVDPIADWHYMPVPIEVHPVMGKRFEDVPPQERRVPFPVCGTNCPRCDHMAPLGQQASERASEVLNKTNAETLNA